MIVINTETNNKRGENTMNCYAQPNKHSVPHHMHLHHMHPHRMHPHHMHPHHVHPAPPPAPRAMLDISFDEKDREMLLAIFGDQDSAATAESIIYEAPPEVQILAMQSLSMAEQLVQLPEEQPAQQAVEESQEVFSCKAVENRARMSCPVLGESAKRQFVQLYGEVGEDFCFVLGSVPYEIAVIARILAYLNEKAGEINGHH